METIPQELFLDILDYVGSSALELLPYVTVSPRWQYVIEQHTFHSLTFKDSEFSFFENLFRPACAHRKAFLKMLTLRIAIPRYEDGDYQQYKNTSDQIFSNTVHKMFQVLESLGQPEAIKNGSGLEVAFRFIHSLTCNRTMLAIMCPELPDKSIKLLNYEKLPTLSCVSSFSWPRSYFSHQLDPVPLMLAANKLSDHDFFSIDYFNDREYFGIDAQKKMRNAFAKAVTTYSHSMGHLRVDFRYSSPLDEALDPPNLIPSPHSMDPLNLAFHNLIQDSHVSAVTFYPQHVISPEFFWPYDDPYAVPTKLPFWPHLKDITVICSPATPDGDWYFTCNPSIASHADFACQDTAPDDGEAQSQTLEYRDRTNSFRSIPNPCKMNPLLIAMARAVINAPSVRQIHMLFGSVRLRSKLLGTDSELKRTFNVRYYSSGISRETWTQPVDRNRLICEVPNWRMDEEVARHWKEALGPEGVIIYR